MSIATIGKTLGKSGIDYLRKNRSKIKKELDSPEGKQKRKQLFDKLKKGFGKKMLTGGQAKIAAKAPPPNKIDEKDFAVLRAEKARGRGQGLQDEKMKPGKIMKARAGKMFTKEQKKKYPGLAKAGSVTEYLKRKKEVSGKGKMTFSDKMKAQDQGLIDKKTGRGAKELMKRAGSVSLGKRLLLPVAAGIATVQYLKKKMKEKKENKKMGGGMMKRAEGGPATDERKRRAPRRGQQATRGLSGGVGALGPGKTATKGGGTKKPKGYVIITGNSYDKARKEVEAEGGSPRLKTEDDKSGRVINKVFGNVRGRSEYAFQSGGMSRANSKGGGYDAGTPGMFRDISSKGGFRPLPVEFKKPKTIGPGDSRYRILNRAQKSKERKEKVKEGLKKIASGIGKAAGPAVGAIEAGKQIYKKIKEKSKTEQKTTVGRDGRKPGRSGRRVPTPRGKSKDPSLNPNPKTPKIMGAMGGGMMMRPTNYNKGSMIKARGGGIARTKPTKMY
jgi:hypothetical protein